MEKLISVVVVTFVVIGLKTSKSSALVDDDVFSSVAKMEILVDQENNIVNLLDSYLQSSKQQQKIIQK